MKRFVVACFMLAVSVIQVKTVFAGMDSGSGSDVFVFQSAENASISIGVTKDAEFASVNLCLSSSMDTASSRIQDVSSAMDILTNKIALVQGARILVYPPSTETRYSKSNIFSESSSSDNMIGCATIYFKFDNYSTPYTVYKKINEFFNSANLPKSINMKYGDFWIGVSEPNKERENILKMIKNRMLEVQAIFGKEARLTMNGTEDVVVVPIGGKKVKLYIPYRISINDEK